MNKPIILAYPTMLDYYARSNNYIILDKPATTSDKVYLQCLSATTKSL